MGLNVDIQLERLDFTLDVSFHADAGATGLFGPSGCGKTTLIHALAGLVTPTRGTIVLGERVLFDRERRIDIPPHRRGIGLVFQEPRLFPHLSVARNLCYARRAADEARSKHVVELLDLGPLLERKPRALSGGESQRVALGRVLMMQPGLLLMDEPLSSLDRELKARILPYVKRVREELRVPMLYVSHDLEEVLELTGQMILVNGGRITGAGGYLELLRDAVCRRRLQEAGLLNVLPATVLRRDDEGGCLEMAVAPAPGAQSPIVFASLKELSAGARVDLVLRPEDIVLSLSVPTGISVQNRLAGPIRRLLRDADRVLCEVDVGIPLLAEVTPHAVATLGLREGLNVWCLFKSRAVRVC